MTRVAIRGTMPDSLADGWWARLQHDEQRSFAAATGYVRALLVSLRLHGRSPTLVGVTYNTDGSIHHAAFSCWTQDRRALEFDLTGQLKLEDRPFTGDGEELRFRYLQLGPATWAEVVHEVFCLPGGFR